jgi:hypothetical protein
MTRRRLALGLLTTVMLAAAAPVRAGEIQPHMLGWEQVFRIEFAPVPKGTTTVLEGVLTNVSPYNLTGIRLLVDVLDASGQMTSQQLSFVPGGLGGGDHVPFSISVVPAPAYRVRVYTYDRAERSREPFFR